MFEIGLWLFALIFSAAGVAQIRSALMIRSRMSRQVTRWETMQATVLSIFGRVCSENSPESGGGLKIKPFMDASGHHVHCKPSLRIELPRKLGQWRVNTPQLKIPLAEIPLSEWSQRWRTEALMAGTPEQKALQIVIEEKVAASIGMLPDRTAAVHVNLHEDQALEFQIARGNPVPTSQWKGRLIMGVTFVVCSIGIALLFT